MYTVRKRISAQALIHYKSKMVRDMAFFNKSS